jgi:hypothetical protein
MKKQKVKRYSFFVEEKTRLKTRRERAKFAKIMNVKE